MYTGKKTTHRRTTPIARYLPANWRSLTVIATTSFITFGVLAAVQGYASQQSSNINSAVFSSDAGESVPGFLVLMGNQEVRAMRLKQENRDSKRALKSPASTGNRDTLSKYVGPRRVTVLKLNKNDIERLEEINQQVAVLNHQLELTTILELRNRQTISRWKGKVQKLKQSYGMIYQLQHPDIMPVAAKIAAFEKLVDAKISNAEKSRFDVAGIEINDAKL